MTKICEYDEDIENKREEKLDELHDQAASFSRISMTLADWRKQMLDCLTGEIPNCFATRYKLYRDAGIPESVCQELDATVFHTALNRKIPKAENAESN